MKNFYSLFVVLILVVTLTRPSAAGEREQLIQLQTTVQMLQDNMSRMQQSLDERMGTIKNLVDHETDKINKLDLAVQNMQKTLGSQTSEAAGKVDQISGQVQSVHDAVDEVKAKLTKLSKQLDEIQSAQRTLPAQQPSEPNPAQAPTIRR